VAAATGGIIPTAAQVTATTPSQLYLYSSISGLPLPVVVRKRGRTGGGGYRGWGVQGAGGTGGGGVGGTGGGGQVDNLAG
jgi:hypothetical protein